MEFLDKLVLPQSAEHIELLHYMLMLVLFLFIPFISVVFGGAILSYTYRRKFNKYGEKNYLRFAKDVINNLTVNSSVGLILGVIPLLTAILILTQLLHTTNFPTVSDLSLSFLFISAALILVYTYRLTFALKIVFDGVDTNSSDDIVKEEFSNYYAKASKLSDSSIRLGLVLLFIGMWIFSGALTAVIYFGEWKPTSFFATLFSLKVIINFLIWIFSSFALTGITLLFIFLFWKKDEIKLSDDYREFIVSTSSKMALYSAVPLPLLIFIAVTILPDSLLSGAMFGYTAASLILLFLSLNFLYLLYYKKQIKYASLLFFTFLAAMLSIIVKNQITINNATKFHSVILSTEYEKVLAELRGTGAEVQINAAELYQVRCAACHKFDQKLVGPAHLDVLPKYAGNEAKLVAFIRNPVKVDPAYPPMPNPGLKPAEAEAVAKYLLDEFEKRKK